MERVRVERGKGLGGRQGAKMTREKEQGQLEDKRGIKIWKKERKRGTWGKDNDVRG